jgi:type II secretory pathway pseudopilin PulG
MRRYSILTLAALALAIPAGAQSTSSTETNATVQADASASAGASRQKQSTPSKQNNKQSPSPTSASASASNAASASANAGGASLNLANNTAVQATLLTPLDARHNKPGDRVVARTTQDVKQDGQVVLQKGSRLIGHVTQAQARSKQNAESSLGVVFDNAVTKHGQQAPVHLDIQALAAAANQTSASLGQNTGMLDSGTSAAGSGRASGGGLLGGAGGTLGGVAGGAGSIAGNAGNTVNGTVGATTQVAGSAAGAAGGLNAAGQLTSASTGVIGLQGLNLTSAVSNGTQASVVNSTSRNVHLDSGTQMVLRVVSQ